MGTTDFNDFQQDRRFGQSRGGEGEKLEVKSGYVVAIDQYMLSNQQFIARVSQNQDIENITSAVKDYGGCVWRSEPGTYRVHRDPFQTAIVVARSIEDTEPDYDAILADPDAMDTVGKVYVDTRCVAFIDKEILSNEDLLERYSHFRQKGDDKQARDLLREAGGAVRYGFSIQGDQLGVYRVGESTCLWPD